MYYCKYNTLTIKGSEKEVENVKNYLRTTYPNGKENLFYMDKIMPLRERIKYVRSIKYNNSIYARYDENQLNCIKFATFLFYPDKIIEKLSIIFPKLVFILELYDTHYKGNHQVIEFTIINGETFEIKDYYEGGSFYHFNKFSISEEDTSFDYDFEYFEN